MIGISKAGFGGGLGVLIGPILALLIPAKRAMGWMLPLLFLCDSCSLFPYWKKWDWAQVRPLLAGGVGGTLCGALALRAVDDQLLAKIIGAVAILFTVLQMLRARVDGDKPLVLPTWGIMAIGLGTGFVSTLSHVGGLLTSSYLLTQRLDARTFVATATLFYFFLNLIKLPVYWHEGMTTQETLQDNVPYVPLVFLGTAAGVYLNKHVPGEWFNWLMRAFVIGAGFLLLVQ